ncbi:MAG: C40 family peptidase [Niabella sp.]
MQIRYLLILVISLLFFSCAVRKKSTKTNVLSAVSSEKTQPKTQKGQAANNVLLKNGSVNINRKEFVNYSEKFLGVPYLYGSAEPAKGFDCSGFLLYVFNHFNIKAPRTSYSYENVGNEVTINKAQPGDLILFTANEPEKIGHIGIVTKAGEAISFIHASTSKGVIISTLSGYYEKHFVKIISVLK